MTVPQLAWVRVWGEGRGERKLPGTVLRVLISGHVAGGVQRIGDEWVAQATGLRPSAPTTHASADEAVRAVLRSSWARSLGARAASPVHWSDKARRAASRGSAR